MAARTTGPMVLVAAWMLLASYLVSTLLSPSIPVSLWGREPALDGNSFYNTLSHFLLFLVVATHLKRTAQLWRLLGAISASGSVLGLYAVLQYYGFDPFGIHMGGGGVVSSLGNPIFTGAFLLMVAPVTLAWALKSNGASASATRTIFWVIPLTLLVLGMAFTQARGPWVGLAAGMATFLVLVGIATGWRASLRALSISATAIAVTWAILTLIPAPTGRAELAPRAWSAGSAVVSTLAAELPSRQAVHVSAPVSAVPSSMEMRILLWKVAAQIAMHRPWFQPKESPLPLSLHLFGYGPEFFQYVFPLLHPEELSHLNTVAVYYGVNEAHNYTLNLWVELGLIGLSTYFVLFGAVVLIGIRMILDKQKTTQIDQRIAVAAVLAVVAGRSVEQLAGISHLSDAALLWTLLAVVAATPALNHETSPEKPSSWPVQNPLNIPRFMTLRVGPPVLQVSLALVLAAVVLGFTLVKNTNYALAEYKATSAGVSLDDSQPEIAMQSIDEAIALAPDVGRYHVIRANIPDRARISMAGASDQARLALETYQANGRAVAANPFDMYGRLYLAESALTLAALGQAGKDEEAVEEYRRLTLTLPRYWLTHFLLVRAYAESGNPGHAIAPFG